MRRKKPTLRRIVYCELGRHHFAWSRQITDKRSPRWCSDHAPVGEE